jgi:hypothetical protein
VGEWCQYQQYNRGVTPPPCVAPPAMAAFIHSVLSANSHVLDEIFNDAPAPWPQVYEDGRLFANMAAISYTEESLPLYHADPKTCIFMFSFTLGTQQRWFVAEDVKGRKITKRTLALDPGSAYFASPYLFRHGTWNAKPDPTAPIGGWRGSTLAIHCRPLMTQAEFEMIDPADPAYHALLTKIQDAIAKGQFRTPSLQEATTRQQATFRAEHERATALAATALAAATKSQATKKPQRATALAATALAAATKSQATKKPRPAGSRRKKPAHGTQ